MTDASSETVRLNLLKGAGQEMAENFGRWIERDGKTRLECLRGIGLFFADKHKATELSDRIVAEGPMSETVSEGLENILRAEAVPEFMDKVGRFDALSQICIGTSSDDKRWEPFWLYNPAAWTRGLEVPGHFGIIHGPALGVGKSATGVVLMDGVTARGLHVITNIPTTPPEARADLVHDVSRLSALMLIAIAIEESGGTWLGFLDESLFFFNRQSPMSEETRSFDLFMRWVRKFNGSLVLITHFSERDIPEKAKPFLRTNIRKVTKTKMVVQITTDHFRLYKSVDGVPDAPWPFDTKGKGGLEVDIDMAHFHAWLNHRQPGSRDRERELMREYLTNPSVRDGDTGTVEVVVEEPRQSAEDIARAIHQDEQFWDAKGYAEKALIRSRFGIGKHMTDDVAKLARRLRKEAGLA